MFACSLSRPPRPAPCMLVHAHKGASCVQAINPSAEEKPPSPGRNSPPLSSLSYPLPISLAQELWAITRAGGFILWRSRAPLMKTTDLFHQKMGTHTHTQFCMQQQFPAFWRRIASLGIVLSCPPSAPVHTHRHKFPRARAVDGSPAPCQGCRGSKAGSFLLEFTMLRKRARTHTHVHTSLTITGSHTYESLNASPLGHFPGDKHFKIS